MHTVFALLCFVVVIHWLIFPYPSGLLHWHCGNLTIAPVPAKQPWWIWINTSCEFIMNDCITTTKQSTTKPCAYFSGYTVCVSELDHHWLIYCPVAHVAVKSTFCENKKNSFFHNRCLSCPGTRKLNLRLLKLEYPGRSMWILWMLMLWLIVSPGQWQPWCWLSSIRGHYCRRGRITTPCAFLSVEKW